jgi:hypothetical protein
MTIDKATIKRSNGLRRLNRYTAFFWHVLPNYPGYDELPQKCKTLAWYISTYDWLGNRNFSCRPLEGHVAWSFKFGADRNNWLKSEEYKFEAGLGKGRKALELLQELGLGITQNRPLTPFIGGRPCFDVVTHPADVSSVFFLSPCEPEAMHQHAVKWVPTSKMTGRSSPWFISSTTLYARHNPNDIYAIPKRYRLHSQTSSADDE